MKSSLPTVTVILSWMERAILRKFPNASLINWAADFLFLRDLMFSPFFEGGFACFISSGKYWLRRLSLMLTIFFDD